MQLALLAGVGLVSALMGAGPWHRLAWVCLTVPTVAAWRALLAGAR